MRKGSEIDGRPPWSKPVVRQAPIARTAGDPDACGPEIMGVPVTGTSTDPLCPS